MKKINLTGNEINEMATQILRDLYESDMEYDLHIWNVMYIEEIAQSIHDYIEELLSK